MRGETEKKYKELLTENSRLKAVETNIGQVSGQKRNLEGVIADLEKALKEKEARERQMAGQIEELSRKIGETEVMTAAHAKELAKMVS